MNNTIKIVSIKLRYIIFIIIGILLSFSLPPYNLTIICFIVFPVLLFFLDWLIKEKYSNFFLFGLSFGFGYFLSSLYWISYSLNFDKNLEILKPFAIIFIPLFLSFFYGIAFFIYKKFVGKGIKSILYFSITTCIIFSMKPTSSISSLTEWEQHHPAFHAWFVLPVNLSTLESPSG